jgi:hypothetical protein
MAKHYREAPWWWYISILVGSFVLGLVVVIKENITLPAWAYVVSLILGSIIAPVVSSPIPWQALIGTNRFYRALCFTPAMVTELPPTISPRCWLV